MKRLAVVAIGLVIASAVACQLEPTVAPTAEPTAAAPTTGPSTEAPTAEPPTDAPTAEPPPTTAPPTVAPPTAAPPTAVPPTAAPAAPVILSFTAEPMDIVEGQDVTLRWQGQRATEASVWWYDRRAIPAPPVNYTGNANDGTTVINPDNSPIFLTLRNAAGEATAEVALVVRCAHEWGPELAASPPGSCPGELINTWAAQQPFENGFMVWLDTSNTIYVFYDNERWSGYIDTFEEGDLESDPSIVPPAGLYQPVRGFGLVWRTFPEVRNGLGWATAAESGFDSWYQTYAGTGLHNMSTFVRGISGQVYQMEHFGSTWWVYQ